MPAQIKKIQTNKAAQDSPDTRPFSFFCLIIWKTIHIQTQKPIITHRFFCEWNSNTWCIFKEISLDMLFWDVCERGASDRGKQKICKDKQKYKYKRKHTRLKIATGAAHWKSGKNLSRPRRSVPCPAVDRHLRERQSNPHCRRASTWYSGFSMNRGG